ncbi:hypothetical protein KP77_28610 [Jeotgalibacillus alimentarius]|uniref:Uncharacterized protein n=1 Tax=Jeotgalibacillus alimentarius TaxID=135826 RepID=A0A0C2RV21_9BACL|nr:hypothetical protein [Jeotgalibacillus alimentarius]KIL45569.1 hypothetical protein KP77_28610 [Jeotgalibacillus alimentarius]
MSLLEFERSDLVGIYGYFCAINSKQIAVTFNRSVSGLTEDNFKVSNLSVTDVAVNGNVATLTVSSDLSNGTTYTVTATGIEGSEDSSASFTYEVAEAKDIELTKSSFTLYDNEAAPSLYDFVVVRQDGKEVSESMIAANGKNIQTNNTAVVTSAGEVIGAGEATVNIVYTLVDGTVLETGNIKVSAKSQAASQVAGFTIEGQDLSDFENTVEFEAAEALDNNRTILYTNETNVGKFLNVFADDANGDPLTEELVTSNGENVTYEVTSGSDLLQVNKNTGAIIYAANNAEGTATVKVTKGSFTYNAVVELRKAPEVKTFNLSKSALQVSEDRFGAQVTPDAATATNQDVVDDSLKSTTFSIDLLDQYGAFFLNDTALAQSNNKYNDVNIALDTNFNTTGYEVSDGQVEVAITYTVGTTVKTGKLVLAVDSNKLTFEGATGANSIGTDSLPALTGTVKSTLSGLNLTAVERNINSDESTNVTVKFFDTTNGANKEVASKQLPVTIKDVSSVAGQKVFKSNDLDAGTSSTLSSTLELWEVDAQGDKVRQVTAGNDAVNETVTAGADGLYNTADDVTLSSNEKVVFDFTTTNTVIDEWVGVTGDLTSNSALLTTGDAEVTYTFVDASAPTLFGENGKITVDAKTGDASAATTDLITAQTVDVLVTNSDSVGYKANIATNLTVDVSDYNELVGTAANSSVRLDDVIFGLAAKDEFIFDTYTSGVQSIALKNGEDGYSLGNVITVLDQNGEEMSLGLSSYGEAEANFDNAGTSLGSYLLDPQYLTFSGTVVDSTNLDATIGASVNSLSTVTLDSDEEEGTLKVLLTEVTRNNEPASVTEKNLLERPVTVTIKFTK